MKVWTDRFIWIVLASACGFCIWQKMEWATIAMAILLCAQTYRHFLLRVVEVLLEILTKAKLAKFGSFEIEVNRTQVAGTSFKDLMLADLSPAHIGLLIQIRNNSDFKPHGDSIMNRLRELRNRGLIAHDEAFLANSKRVWLTSTGGIVADGIVTGLDSEKPA